MVPDQIDRLIERLGLDSNFANRVDGPHLHPLARQVDESVVEDELRDPHGRWSTTGGDAQFLGDLPVPVDKNKRSHWTEKSLRDVGDAIRDSIARHPEILSKGFNRVVFRSELRKHEYPGSNRALDQVLAAHATLRGGKESHLVLNDEQDDPGVIGQSSQGEWFAPATRTPYGMITHEMGHAFFVAHAVNDSERAQKLLDTARISLLDVAKVSSYAMTDAEEALAELYGQQFTPGFGIQDEGLRDRFVRLVDAVHRVESRKPHWWQRGDMK